MNEQSVSDGHPTDRPNSVHAEISRAMVRLYKEQFGRGPTKVRTDFANPDVLLCTLEHSFTAAEKKLAEMGEHQRLRDTRIFFQSATENEFRGIVERILGRKVRGFISGIDTEQDVSVELFYLEPRGNGDGAEDGDSSSRLA